MGGIRGRDRWGGERNGGILKAVNRWGDGGRSGTYKQLVPALRPMKTEETVRHRQNNNVIKEVGTPPVPKRLVYSATCSFNSCAKNRHKGRVRETSCSNLKQKTVQLTMTAQLHHPLQIALGYKPRDK